MKKINKQNIAHFAGRQRYQLKRAKWNNGTRKRAGKIGFNKWPNIFEEHKAPPIFNLMPENIEFVLDYIYKLKKMGSKKKSVDFNLKDVKEIGVGAISMLLSVMEELRSQGIRFKGTKPSSIIAKNILEQSGFMKFVHGSVSPENRNSRNTIYTGNKRTHHHEFLGVIHDSMYTVWGELGRCQQLYGIIVEMMKNSCKHAFLQNNKVRWHFGVSHDTKEKSVKFSFVDNGIGIVKSHELDNFYRRVQGLFRDNSDFIEGAFTEGIKSKTGLSWRGTGLPFIYETFDDRIIKNFVVITNNVYINFESGYKQELKNSFDGTYYYFEIDTSCEKQCFPINNDTDKNSH